jgi:hypothetical protein
MSSIKTLSRQIISGFDETQTTWSRVTYATGWTCVLNLLGLKTRTVSQNVRVMASRGVWRPLVAEVCRVSWRDRRHFVLAQRLSNRSIFSSVQCFIGCLATSLIQQQWNPNLNKCWINFTVFSSSWNLERFHYRSKLQKFFCLFRISCFPGIDGYCMYVSLASTFPCRRFSQSPSICWSIHQLALSPALRTERPAYLIT